MVSLCLDMELGIGEIMKKKQKYSMSSYNLQMHGSQVATKFL